MIDTLWTYYGLLPISTFPYPSTSLCLQFHPAHILRWPLYQMCGGCLNAEYPTFHNTIFGLCLCWLLFNFVWKYIKGFPIWVCLLLEMQSLSMCFVTSLLESRRSSPRMTGIMLKWPSSKNVTNKPILHYFWWRFAFEQALLLRSFHFIKWEKGQKTADKRTQMQRLHFSLEDVKISVFKKIKGSTLNAERCLKCRHCSVL